MIRFLMLVGAAVALVSCGSSSPSAPSTSTGSSANMTIQIQGNLGSSSYSPSPTTVRVGQTVAWHNADSITHNSTQDNGTFSTGNIAGGGTSSPITMNTAGTFTYHCSIHPGMVGTITVQ